jgi:hypothetical protein
MSPNSRAIIQHGPSTEDRFKLFAKIPVHQIATFRSPLKGLWDENTLSKTFFSNQNMQALQNGIRHGVYTRSNGQYIVGPQDYDALKIIMRSIFLQYSDNQPDHIAQQIESLNYKVLSYCVQQVYGEAKGYIRYLDDSSRLPVPISMPVSASQHNTVLEAKPWF